MKYKVINIQSLELFNPIIDKNRIIKAKTDNYCIGIFGHYPAIIDHSGKPLAMGNLFLLNILKNNITVRRDTLRNHAYNLSSFMTWCSEEGIDPYKMPKRKLARPTYRYRIYLQSLIENGEYQASTCSTKLSTVITFYKWLIYERQYKFLHKPWVDKNISIKYTDLVGNNYSLKVNSTDIAIKVNNQTETGEYIFDEGKLVPLNLQQQSIMLNAVQKIGNIEKILMFEIALRTGARISTICTLRKNDFMNLPIKGQSEIPIAIGQGTLVSNKYDKRMNLFFPRSLYFKIKSYLESPRWRVRNINSNTNLAKSDTQYIFITKFGNPYYLHKYDPHAHTYSSFSKGGGIRNFIEKQLIPVIKEMGHEFKFRFHDLRATYGLNLLMSVYPQIDETPEKTLLALKIVQEKMGHSNLHTTDGYLKFRNNLIYKNTLDKFIFFDEK